MISGNSKGLNDAPFFKAKKTTKRINTSRDISPREMNHLPQEKFPISETLRMIDGTDLYKTDKWWSAVILLESFGRKQVAVYLWQKSGEQWKRRQKFVIRDKNQWKEMKETIEKFVPKLVTPHHNSPKAP